MPIMRFRTWIILTGITGIAQSAYYYTLLPEQVASHFGFSGMPDGWMPRAGNFFVSAGLFIFITGMMLCLAKLLRVLPSGLINIPNREYWLSDERKERTLENVAELMNIFGIAINLFFIFMNHMVFLANKAKPVRLNDNMVLLALGIFLLFTAGWLWFFYRRFHTSSPACTP